MCIHLLHTLFNFKLLEKLVILYLNFVFLGVSYEASSSVLYTQIFSALSD